MPLDITKRLLNDLGSYRRQDLGFVDQAYYQNNPTSTLNTDYGLFDWGRDAWHSLYRSVQRGEMQESEDRMALNRQNIEDASDLLDAYTRAGGEGGEDEEAERQERIRQSLDRLITNGTWTKAETPTAEDLQGIIESNQADYDKNLKDYKHNSQQLGDDYLSYDISQHFTRRSNESTSMLGNFWYTLPATMGTSNTSPFLQTASMAAGAAGWKLGAGIGSAAPVIGTVGGAILGGLLSIGASLALGGIQSRQNESHMEAFNAYAQNVIDKANALGTDLGKVVDNVKQQMLQQGINTVGLTNEDVLHYALSSNDVVTGSAEFDRLAKDTFKGTRRVYEQNNALGAGEALSDLSYFVPVGKYLSKAAGTVGKAVLKKAIPNVLAKRFGAGLEVANLGNQLRKKVISDTIWDFAKGATLRSAVEASEEGAQNLIVKKYLNGEYDEDDANPSFVEALKDGLIAADLFDNIWLRSKSMASAFGLSSENRDDTQMFTEMFGGAILPFTSPQGLVGGATNVRNIVNKISNSKRVGDAVAEQLMKLDAINRSEEFFKNSASLGGIRTYDELLSDIGSMLKDRDSSGKTYRYNLDTTGLVEDGLKLTDEDIDSFIEDERRDAARMLRYKKDAQPTLDELGIEKEDQPLALALGFNALNEYSKVHEVSEKLQEDNVKNFEALKNDTEFKKQVSDVLGEEASADDVNKFANLYLRSQRASAYLEMYEDGTAQAAVQTALKQAKVTSTEHLVDLAKAMTTSWEHLHDSYTKLNEDIKTFVTDREKAKNPDVTEEEISDKIEDFNNKLDNFTTQTVDSEVVENIQNLAKNQSKLNVLSTMLGEKYVQLTQFGVKEKDGGLLKEAIEQYKAARLSQTRNADATNEALRNGQEEVTELKSPDASSELKVTDLTAEKVAEEYQVREEQTKADSAKLKEIVDNIQDTSILRDMRDEIHKGEATIGEDPLTYARYVKNVVKRLTNKYDKATQKEGVTEEDKKLYSQLKTVTDGLATKLDRMLKLKAEAKAKAQQYNPRFESSNRVYRDTAGNRYQFNTDLFRYSENEGLVLSYDKLGEQVESPAVKEQVTKLEEQIDKLEKEKTVLTANNARSVVDIEKEQKPLKQLLQSLKENQVVENGRERFVTDTNNPLFDELYTLDNNGNREEFSKLLNKWKTSVDADINDHKLKRLKRAEIPSVDGDVYEYSYSATSIKDHAPSMYIDIIEKGNDRAMKVKGYPLGGENIANKKIATKLINPYYDAGHWYGYLSMPYQSVDEIRSEIESKYAEKTINGKRYSRYKAVEVFNKIGGQIVYLKEHNGDVNAAAKDLEKLANGEVDKVKIGIATLTKEEFDNMVWSLPVRMHLAHLRSGNQWNWIVTADFMSVNRTTMPTEGEIESRAELVMNLLYKYKRTKDATEEGDKEGFSQEEEKPEFMNRVYIQKGGIQIVYKDYNYETTSERNPNLNIYQNTDGEQMSQAEINQHYQDVSKQAADDVTPRISELVEMLNSIGYDVKAEDLMKPLSADNQDVTKLEYLIQGALKYGDGVIDLHKTFIPKYVVESVGKAVKNTASVSKANVARARRILKFMYSATPDSFLSHKNFQDENLLTPDVAMSVSDAVRANWFNQKGSIKVFFDGDEISTNRTDENEALLTSMFSMFEKLIRDSKSSQEFITKLHDLGYSFKKNGDETTADEVLTDYFDNRRFSKLSKPTNIVQAITLGKSNPLSTSGEIDYENFNRIERHVQSKISEIKGLGLIKDSNGVYHYSLDEFVKLNSKDDDVKQAKESEKEVRLKQITDERDALLKGMKSAKGDDLINWIIDNKNLFPTSVYDDLLHVNRKGDPILHYKVGMTRAAITSIVDEVYDKKMGDLPQQIEEEQAKQLSVEAGFEGKHTKPLKFGYGSYSVDGISDIIYFDEYNNKHVVKNGTGKPGGIYLIMPAMLSSSRQQLIARLNPKHLNDTEAKFVAALAKLMGDGTISKDIALNQIEIEGYKVDTDMTAQELLDSIVFNGDAAIINNPNDENYSRLFTIDETGVHFGDDTLNDSNYDAFIEFLKNNKTWRVDRDKLSTEAATFGKNVTITDPDGNTMLSRKQNDNYTSLLVDEGILMTDLNRGRSDGSNPLFSTPNVYANYTKARTFTSSAANAARATTAAHKRAQYEEQLGLDEFNEMMEDQESGDGLLKLQKATNKFMDGFTKYVESKGIRKGEYKLGLWGENSKKVVKQFDISFDVNNENGNVEMAGDDLKKIYGTIGASIREGKNHKLVLLDKDGKFVKDSDGNSMFYGNGFVGSKIDVTKALKTPAASGMSSGLEEALTKFASVLTNAVNRLSNVQLGTQAAVQPSGQPIMQPVKPAAPAIKEEAEIKHTRDISNGNMTLEHNGIKVVLPITATLDDVLTEMDNVTNGEAQDSDEAGFRELYNTVKLTIDAALENKSEDEKAAAADGLNFRPSPADSALGQSGTQGPTPAAAKKVAQSVAMPTVDQLLSSTKKNDQALYNRLMNLQDEPQKAAVVMGALMQYGIDSKTALKESRKLVNQIIARPSAKVGSIFQFLDEAVQKEDFDTALSNVKKILGKDFDYSVTDDIANIWDNNRQAQIYVFGECAASGIRLFRDASTNQIARGSFYHEAFHRISLFVLDKASRDKMYDDARRENPELGLSTNQQIEEYIADKFADFVNENLQNGQGKFYSGNLFKRAFQRIYDAVTRIIRKLAGKNITPQYSNLDKLFKDMYSGRFAYAKATVGNIEEFSKMYGKAPAYSGFKSNGVTIADDAVQYNNILRDMVGALIYNSGLVTNKSGRLTIDTDALRKQYERELASYLVGLRNLEQAIKNNRKLNVNSQFSDENLSVAQAKMVLLIDVRQKMLQDDAWKEWTKILKDFVDRQFNLHEDRSNDANQIALEADMYTEPDDVEEEDDDNDNNKDASAQYSNERDSFGRNFFNSLDASMKMFLWLVTDLNPRDVTTAKYTEEGLLKYSNPRTLYTNLIYTLAGSTSVKNMLDKLYSAALNQSQNEDSSTLMLVYEILSNENTDPNFVNRFFTEFVKHIQNFETHAYKITSTVPDEGDTRPKYSADVKSGNVDTVQAKLNNRWKNGLYVSVDRLVEAVSKEKHPASWLSAQRKPLREAMAKLNVDNLDTIKRVITEAYNLYGFGLITSRDITDITKDARIWQKAMQSTSKNAKVAGRLLLNPLEQLNKVEAAHFKFGEGTNRRKGGIYNTIDALFDMKGKLTSLAQRFGDSVKSLPSVQSQRGPGGSKIYGIGAHNYITKVFELLMDDKEWMDMLSKNPYCQHSKWLEFIKQNGHNGVKVLTKLQTVLDDDYEGSSADKENNELVDLMNRLVSIWSGKHATAALANKRYAADITGIPQMTNIVNSNGDINRTVIDTFIGYAADELLAISDALKTREQFINELNAILGSEYTADSFSDLTGEQQEEIFKNNKEAAGLLKKLKKTYHYTSDDQAIQYDAENNRYYRRAFHINLKNPEKYSKGPRGYKFRHFQGLQSMGFITPQLIQKLSGDLWSNENGEFDRTVSAKLAMDTLNKPRVRAYMNQVLDDNAEVAIKKLKELGAIKVDDTTGEVFNLYLPEDAMKRYLGITSSTKLNSDNIRMAIKGAIIQGMSDMVEFEKIVFGDNAFHKNIDAVTKRYSGLPSTVSITAAQGSIRSAFEVEDRLFDSPTYNTVALNTTKITNTAKYDGELTREVGIKGATYGIKDGELSVQINPEDLLDSEGNIKAELKTKPLVKRFLHLRDTNRTIAMKNGKLMTDKELAGAIIADFKSRYEGYLDNDPTDAQSWISSAMFRQLRQRKGKWNMVDESCHNLLQYFDRFTTRDLLSKQSTVEATKEMCRYLGIDYNDLVKRCDNYNKAKARRNQKKMDEYKGWIYEIVSRTGFEAPSLKYIYYGTELGRADNLMSPIYDKTSYSTLYRIFTEGHDADQFRDFMEKNDVQVLKMESATKSGGVPSFEIYDKTGRIDRKALNSSVVQSQYFNLLGDQLNTDSHHSNENALLTQFMKIAVMNVTKDHTYRFNGKKVDGDEVRQMYTDILDTLTTRGAMKFQKKWGLGKTTIDKALMMKSFANMARTENLPPLTSQSFTVDSNGEFVIHPAGMPNAQWIISRLIADMGKSIINTITPGKALYQVAGVGFDNALNVKASADRHLLMPGEIDANGNIHSRMEVRLSIGFFHNVIEQARKAGVKGYDLDNFEGQKKFILDNKELFALSYRVPTQGQNSTLPIEIVDLIPDVRGSIVQFPAGITALTGSDFDIDKMFLARFNYTVEDGKLVKVKYDVDKLREQTAALTDEELQNALLDIYQATLTSSDHALDSSTPLDVCTGPIKEFAKETLNQYRGANTSDQVDLDGYHLNPVFQSVQKKLNSGSDETIGPMALNSVFQAFVQMSGLKPNEFRMLEEFGMTHMGEQYDKDGYVILDTTSGLINAAVDAAKDNYIGNANVNPFTYNILSFMIATGYGKDTFAFINQPIIIDVTNNFIRFKRSSIGVTEKESYGNEYMDRVRKRYETQLTTLVGKDNVDDVTPQENMMEGNALLNNLRTDFNNPVWLKTQLNYLQIFEALNAMADNYQAAIKAAKVDTKKYGTSIGQLIAFTLNVEKLFSGQSFNDSASPLFDYPMALYDGTFLGKKYELGVQGLFDMFKTTMVEFSDVFRNTADTLSKRFGVYGKSANFLKFVAPKIKTVLFTPFFNQYIKERFGGSKPLAKLMYGPTSVPGRYSEIKAKALANDEGVDLFNALNYNQITKSSETPQFMLVAEQFKEDQDVKNNVQMAITELCESNDPEVRQWANDFIAYMFYVSGGTDSNAGGTLRTTVYDIIPPQQLAKLTAGGITFNQFISDRVMSRTKSLSDPEMDQVVQLLAVTDDKIVKTFKSKGKRTYASVIGDDVIRLYKGGGSVRHNGSFDPFIKVQTHNNATYLYRLGDIIETEGKGKIWKTPVYYKANNLGYRNPSRYAFAVRADGDIDQYGNIRSLLNTDTASKFRNYNDLDPNQQDRYYKVLKPVEGTTPYAIPSNNAYDEMVGYHDKLSEAEKQGEKVAEHCKS